VNEKLVLDSFALISLFNKEPGWQTVQKCLYELQAKGERALLCWINWGEVYYVIARRAGRAKALETIHLIEQLPIELVDVDSQLVKSAADVKCDHSLSYADAFCIATAIRWQGVILTSDPEFATVSQLVRIRWLRG
jgi:predicted nucleic acid-binding protein